LEPRTRLSDLVDDFGIQGNGNESADHGPDC
jgi:hypothetical protein